MQICKYFFLFPALTFSSLVWSQSDLFLESPTEETQASSNKSLQTDHLEKKTVDGKEKLEDLEKNAQSLKQKTDQAKAEKEQSALQDLKDLKPTIRVDANDLIKPEFDSAQRAQDFRASFAILKKNNPNGNFYVVVAGRKIPNIIDFHVMPNSSLATLVIKKPSGIEQKVIKTEDLSDVGEVTKKIFITENDD